MRVWKYLLPFTGQNTIEMPIGSQVLSTQLQDGMIYLWVKAPDETSQEQRSFYVLGTGWEVPDECKDFIGTVQDRDLGWHVFERKT